jgi:hypothetical protein
MLLSSQKYGVRIRDLKSGIRKKLLSYPGVRSKIKKAPDSGSAKQNGKMVDSLIPC